MAKRAKNEMVLQIAADLESLYRILASDPDQHCQDLHHLIRAASRCRDARGKEKWSYDMTLRFNAGAGRHPVPAALRAVTVEMILDVEGHADEPEHPKDPLESLAFELFIFSDQRHDVRYHCAWHLDRHIGGEGEEQEGEPEDDHPRYHFHFGGQKMRAGDYGEAIILGSPRLAHAPLDAVLGVDFVLANFLGSYRRKLVSSNPVYQDILHRAQRRFWRPYVRSLVAWWDRADASMGTWVPQDVWPSLVHPAPLGLGRPK